MFANECLDDFSVFKGGLNSCCALSEGNKCLFLIVLGKLQELTEEKKKQQTNPKQNKTYQFVLGWVPIRDVNNILDTMEVSVFLKLGIYLNSCLKSKLSSLGRTSCVTAALCSHD